MTILRCDNSAENIKVNSRLIAMEGNEGEGEDNRVKVSRCLDTF